MIESDLIVIFGANPANDQPVFMKYLHMAKKRGTKVVVVNPFREPGWSATGCRRTRSRAIFGTKIAD